MTRGGTGGTWVEAGKSSVHGHVAAKVRILADPSRSAPQQLFAHRPVTAYDHRQRGSVRGAMRVRRRAATVLLALQSADSENAQLARVITVLAGASSIARLDKGDVHLSTARARR
jgi:hypothetical protein